MTYTMYGSFNEKGKVYRITERKTPRHWYNYFYNDTYNAFASQVAFGEGFAQDALGRRVLMVTNRMLYIRNGTENTWFCASGLPINEPLQEYFCDHGLGYTKFHVRKNDLAVEFTLFVPLEGNREIWTVSITSHLDHAVEIHPIAYCATGIDGSYRPQGYNTDIAWFDEKSSSVIARGFAAFDCEQSRAVYEYLTCDRPVSGFDTAHNAFIGVYGHAQAPEALMETGHCRCSSCLGEKICLAIEAAMHLEPGETQTVHFVIGLADDPSQIISEKETLARKTCETELNAVMRRRLDEIGGVQIETPDELLNAAFNGFYQYATAMGSRWARVRHNGYRDMMSDAECLSCLNPSLAWQRYTRALRYQYASGYAPRTFIDGAIRDNHFADCAVWITFTGYAIVMETGDRELLKEVVPFNDGSEASVYEHIRRSVEFLYSFTGSHGLIRIWGGDWNDCMNEAGLKGRGESVWLSIAWCRAAGMLSELARIMGQPVEAERWKQNREHMEKLIEEYGWDGEYYLTALDDDGRPIGSAANKEGSLYLNPQIWAVLGSVGSAEHRSKAMASVEALETPLGAVVSAPPYTHVDHHIGSMTTKAAGMHENGGVYLHSMCWKLAADAMLGRKDHVARDIAQILPWDQSYAPTVGEPYILFNSYFSEHTGYRYATPGQSWRTASTSWFVKAMTLYVFGLQPAMEGLRIMPCLPSEWKVCRVIKQFRGCTYEIRYFQDGNPGRTPSVTVNGIPAQGVLPCEQGKHYQVEVRL